jgi:glycosyltransferase involved in cell wall biosynthesis
MTPGSREEIRKQWGIPSGAEVFLSFGFVRDGKNLDLVIEALKSVSEAWLVVAGSVASSKDRTFSWYRDHASRLGVSDRCLFYEGFIPEEEAGRFFAGADHLLLCYSSDFHSQSGVLNMAVHARKTVVASGAASAMTDTVRKFRLGVVIDTGSSSAIVQGMKSLLETPPAPLWDDYEQESSWEVNAARLLQAAGLGSSSGS